MGDNSKIEWTDATWNPVTGCTKVSAGCKNCYAERIMKRTHPGRAFTDLLIHDKNTLDRPLHWKRPRRIFVNSMSDLFHEGLPTLFVDAVFQTMAAAKQHTFQILTKRPERMLGYISKSAYLSNSPLPNVWLGVSCEDQKTADERVPLLLDVPAAVRFVSCEPLLGAINLVNIIKHNIEREIGVKSIDKQSFLDWVIVGGESGPHARPMHPTWIQSLKDQCEAAGVPFFFKQWGEWIAASQKFHTELIKPESIGDLQCQWLQIDGASRPIGHGLMESHDMLMMRVGKRNAGRLLDGVEWNQYPEDKCGS